MNQLAWDIRYYYECFTAMLRHPILYRRGDVVVFRRRQGRSFTVR